MIVQTGPANSNGVKAHLFSDIYQQSKASCTMSFFYNMNAENDLVNFCLIIYF